MAELVPRHRLATLIGPPGVGKSRLAMAAARAVEHDFGGGVGLLSLPAPGDPLTLRAWRRTLDARDPTPSRDPLARVVQRLRHANVLLVLDGCEPVIGGSGTGGRGRPCRMSRCAGGGDQPGGAAPEGEVRLVVAPLAVPAAGADAAELAASESVRLFLDRARVSRPGLPVAEDNIALAAVICRRVDGLPLGIELAAARVSVLGLREILSALESRRPLFVEARDRRLSPSATCARWWPGAMTYCTPTKRRCSTSWRCSAAAHHCRQRSPPPFRAD